MAIQDWNGDGKKDWVDDYIEYNVYKDFASGKRKGVDMPSGCFGIILVCISFLANPLLGIIVLIGYLAFRSL